jgi:hypothetical protein
MRKRLTLRTSRSVLATLFALGLGIDGASGGSATWTWPTQRTDNSVLPLSAIGGFTVYDTSVPVPNLPGTAVVGCVAVIPPTTPTGSCTAAFTVGHAYVIVIGDTSAGLSGVSNLATATSVVAPPKAVIDLKVIGP